MYNKFETRFCNGEVHWQIPNDNHNYILFVNVCDVITFVKYEFNIEELATPKRHLQSLFSVFSQISAHVLSRLRAKAHTRRIQQNGY